MIIERRIGKCSFEVDLISVTQGYTVELRDFA